MLLRIKKTAAVLFCTAAVKALLFDKPLYRLVKLVYLYLVVMLHSLGDAFGNMVLQEYLSGVVYRRTHCRDLDKNLGAVLVVVDHADDRLQMSLCLGKAVYNRFFIGVNMRMTAALVGVGMDCSVHMDMTVVFMHRARSP